MSNHDRILYHFDGGCDKKGLATWGVYDSYLSRVVYGTIPYKATNNIAEWTGLIRSLLLIQERNHPAVICGDSELVVKQFNRQYAVKNAGLIPLFSQAMLLRDSVDAIVMWVPRAQNSLADMGTNLARTVQPNGIHLIQNAS